jgi:hypothetical protein
VFEESGKHLKGALLKLDFVTGAKKFARPKVCLELCELDTLGGTRGLRHCKKPPIGSDSTNIPEAVTPVRPLLNLLRSGALAVDWKLTDG